MTDVLEKLKQSITTCDGCEKPIIHFNKPENWRCKDCRIAELETALTKMNAAFPFSYNSEQTAAFIGAYRALGIDIPK